MSPSCLNTHSRRESYVQPRFPPSRVFRTADQLHLSMKTLSALLGLAVLLLLFAYLHEHRQATELQTSLATLAKDRNAIQGELLKLNGRLAELQKRTAVLATAVAAETPRGNSAPAPTAPVLPAPVERPGVTIKAPEGWFKNGAKSGSYVVGVDSTQPWGGMPSAYVESLAPSVEEGFGGMMQTTAADSYAGKRVRLSGWVKTENADEGGGHLWLRVDGQERGQTLQFDNMNNRPVKGTSDWQEASIVLDVPASASALAYGFFVQGGGKMWVNGQKIEEVGPEVPSTNMITKKALPTAPRNLGFDPNRPK